MFFLTKEWAHIPREGVSFAEILEDMKNPSNIMLEYFIAAQPVLRSEAPLDLGFDKGPLVLRVPVHKPIS